MPRVRTSASDPLDFCLHCFPSEELANKLYGNVGDGPDGRRNCFCWDDDHPDYDGENYKCAMCRKPLRERDNYRRVE